MKYSDVKKAIVDYLETIENRVKYINKHHPETNLSLDIDLVKDDIRLLYNKLELLKYMALPKQEFEKNDIKTTDTEVELELTSKESTVTDDLQIDHDDQTTELPIPDSETSMASHPTSMPDVNDQENETTQQTDPADDDTDLAVGKDSLPEAETMSTSVPDKEKIDTQQPLQSSPDSPETIKITPITSTTSTTPKADDESKSADIPEKPDAETSKEDTAEDDTQDQRPVADFSDTVNPAQETERPEAGNATIESSSKATVRIDNIKEVTNNTQKTVLDILSSYSKKTIGDQYISADNSLNRRISSDKEDQSIGARMQQKPISSIKEVIGVNEKFLFINELFHGNIQEYHDAIARLNGMQHMQEAFDYLNKLSEQYSWDASRSSATIEKLANYVQRRYM